MTQKSHQLRRRRDAIHIVIRYDANRLVGFDGVSDALRGFAHVGDDGGVGRVVFERWGEPELKIIVNGAHGHELCHLS